MNEVNKTLFIPLYGKSRVSRMNIILKDPMAEKIWEAEGFPIHGKSASKWLSYNMAMRARVFDDWTEGMLRANGQALVLHIGCGLDSRCMRVKGPHGIWIDADLPEVIEVRRKYFEEKDDYQMLAMDASDIAAVSSLPDSQTVIVVLEGLSMYLTKEQLHGLFGDLEAKYERVHVLMDIYTEFGAKASKYKNPVNDVGVTRLYGIDKVEEVLWNLRTHFIREHSFTPPSLVAELKPLERGIFKLLFTGRMYGKIYRLVELLAE